MGQPQGPIPDPSSEEFARHIARLQQRIAELEGHTVPAELTDAIMATSPSRWATAWIPIHTMASRVLVLLRGRSIEAEPGEVLDYLQHAGHDQAPHGLGPFARDVMPAPLDAAVVDAGDQPRVLLSTRLCGPDVRAAVHTLRLAYQAQNPGRRMLGLVLPTLLLLRELLASAARTITSGSSAAAGMATGSVVTIATVATVAISPLPTLIPHDGSTPEVQQIAPVNQELSVVPAASITPTAAPPTRSPKPKPQPTHIVSVAPLPSPPTDEPTPQPSASPSNSPTPADTRTPAPTQEPAVSEPLASPDPAVQAQATPRHPKPRHHRPVRRHGRSWPAPARSHWFPRG